MSNATQLQTGYEPLPSAYEPGPPASVHPLPVAVGRSGVAPWAADLLSCLGAALCVAAGVSLAAGAAPLLPALLFPLGALCDLADGRVARASARTAEERRKGAFVDSICDKIGEVALFLGIVVAVDDKLVLTLVAAAFAFATLTSYTKAVAGEHRLPTEWPEARVMGRACRVVLLSVLLLLTAAAPEHQIAIFTFSFGTLLVFNTASFLWRVRRVAAPSH